jgi:hypothetical protein
MIAASAAASGGEGTLTFPGRFRLFVALTDCGTVAELAKIELLAAMGNSSG